MAGLVVKVDQVAVLRAIRKSQFPDPVTAAALAEIAGADGISAHLRQDRRYIKDRDVRILRSIVQSKLILEMASTTEMVGVALDIKPDLVTLVPDQQRQLKANEHDGEEILFILEGEVEISLGDYKDILKPGDSIYYDSTLPHVVSCYGNEPAILFPVIYAKKEMIIF